MTPRLITEGPFTGWKLCGPYKKSGKTQAYEYYILRLEGHKSICITPDKLDLLDEIPKKEIKPFLDWIK